MLPFRNLVNVIDLKNKYRTILSGPRFQIFWKAKIAFSFPTDATFSYPLYCYCRLAGQVWFVQMERKKSKVGYNLYFQYPNEPGVFIQRPNMAQAEKK